MRLPLPCLLVLAATLSVPAPARAQDAWFGSDKALHFGASAALAGGGYALGAVLSDDVRFRLGLGAAVGLGAGAGKELWDLSGHGDASWKDFAWDVIGTGVGLLVAWSIDRLFFHHLAAPEAPTPARPGVGASLLSPPLVVLSPLRRVPL